MSLKTKRFYPTELLAPTHLFTFSLPSPSLQLLLSDGNRVALMTVNEVDSSIIWESKSIAIDFDPRAQGPESIRWDLEYPSLRDAVERGVRHSVAQSMDFYHTYRHTHQSHHGGNPSTSTTTTTTTTSERGPQISLSSALSRALLYIHRIRISRRRIGAAGEGRSGVDPGSGVGAGVGFVGNEGATPTGATPTAGMMEARILSLTGSDDAPGQHVALMNAIFAAKSSHVALDACRLGTTESPLLEQGAALTGGHYVASRSPGTLLPRLLREFLGGGIIARGRLGKQLLSGGETDAGGADPRARCFCHRRQVAQGWVCSVCLSVFCERRQRCTTCKAEFGADLGGLAGGKRGRDEFDAGTA